MDKLISASEYAKKNGLTARRVRKKCQDGGFKTAVKIGSYWAIDEDEPYIDLRKKEEKDDN